MKVSIIGIDWAKDVFQVAALNQARKPIMNRSVRRAKLLDVVRRFEPTVLAMEACGSSHYWGRVFQRMGHQVRLIPPQHVKPFSRVNKTDAGDALAICEAARRPNIHFVAIQSIAQQDLRLLRRARQRLVQQRTATSNQIRGFAREYGVFFPKGYRKLLDRLPAALEDGENELSTVARRTLSELQQEMYQLSDRIEHFRKRENRPRATGRTPSADSCSICRCTSPQSPCRRSRRSGRRICRVARFRSETRPGPTCCL